ncbi:MAG: fumarylacetoacetate hydrolase family protein [Candidatus Micrarchaeota archaeon]
MRIIQVIGCAYTYRVSLAVRDSFAKDRADHSSHKGKDAFSYFKKVENPEDIIRGGGSLVLRKHPETGKQTDHWYEPELALLLGPKHTIVAYALANDLTAANIEFERSKTDYDPTYFGKCWPGSCSIGTRFYRASKVGNVNEIEIGLRIIRDGSTIYDNSYSTSQRLREFAEFPELIFARREELLQLGPLPQSKRITIGQDGFLPKGTIILAGTGLILPKRCYAQAGDKVTIYSTEFGELRNSVQLEF